MDTSITIAPGTPRTIAQDIRPTPLGERTLLGALVGLCVLALVFGGALLFPAWPASTAGERVHYLGWALLLSVVGILIMVAAFASPWIGSIKISGMGGAIDIAGDKTDGG